MSIEPRYILVVIVAWLIVAGLIIIPRIMKKKTIHANTTLGDVVEAIYSLKDTIKDTIYIAMGIEICVIVAAIAMK